MLPRTLVITLALSAAILPAFAHAHLVRSSPANGAAVAADQATAVRLTFSEPVEAKLSGASVTSIATEAAGAAQPGEGKSEIVVPLKAPLAPGRYEVKWYAISADTHKSQGVFSFEVKP